MKCTALGCPHEAEPNLFFCRGHIHLEGTSWVLKGPLAIDPTEHDADFVTGKEGRKFDSEKPRWDLLPFDALDDVAMVLKYGAKKYADRNWEKGMAWGRLLGAGLRHASAWALGQDLDAESGLPHLAHAACCFLMLLALVRRREGTDDRKVLR